MRTVQEFTKAFADLGIVGERVVVHSSLSSFGQVVEGAQTVIDALVTSFPTVMMPAFCWDSNAAPPQGDRVERNGCHYSFYDSWQKPLKPFLVETAGIEKSMGVIAKTFLEFPAVERSDHPWHSWAVVGDGADELVRDHLWTTTNIPLERLAATGGWVLLMGVGLNSCTAIHVAEERAGRCPFIRWMCDRDGIVRPVSVSGCAKGFNNLMPFCKDLFRETSVGEARILAAPLGDLIGRAAIIMAEQPEITQCVPDCIRCRDAILGGPL